jgi:hypothetical protein
MAANLINADSRAAKVVATGEIRYDTARMEKRVEEQVLLATQEAVSGMNYLQISRERGTVGISLQYAISHLRNALDCPSLVSTPPPDSINWFYHRTMPLFLPATEYLEPVIQEDDDGSKHFFVHPAFQQFRERDMCIWSVRIGPYNWDGVPDDLHAHWVVIIAATRPLEQPVFVPRGQAVAGIPDVDHDRDRYYDREVADVQVFDPLGYPEEKRRVQRRRILTYFSFMCRRASTLLRPAELRREPGYPKIPATWQTGFMCYAIVMEFFRRVGQMWNSGFSVLDIGEDHDPMDPNSTEDEPDDPGMSGREFWDNIMRATYAGLEPLDSCRESMMAGCAVRAIQMSEYRARLAIELPGISTSHKPERLHRVKGPRVQNPIPLDPEQKIGRLMMGVYSSNAAS